MEGEGEKDKEKNFFKNKNEDNNISMPSDVNEELFVTGIREWMTEQNLRDTFEKYGEVDSVKALKMRHTDKNKGTGFIRFKEKKSAFKAMMDARNIYCKGKSLKIKYNKKDSREKTSKYNDRKENGSKKSFRESSQKNSKKSSLKSWGKKYDQRNNEDSKKGKNKDDDDVSHYSNYKERSREKDNKDIDDW